MDGQIFIDVPEAGRRVFGVGKAQSYALVERGLIPVIRAGRRCLVPVAALDKLTSEMAANAAETAAANWRKAASESVE